MLHSIKVIKLVYDDNPITLVWFSDDDAIVISNLLSTEREGRTGEYWPDRGYQCGPSTATSLQKRSRINILQYGSSKVESLSVMSTALASIRKQKWHVLWPFPWKRSPGRNPVQNRTNLACVAGGMRERASGGGAAIFFAGEAREEFATLHQSSHGFATRVHGFATKTKALAHEIPPATQARTN